MQGLPKCHYSIIICFAHWKASSSNIHICTVDWRKICFIFIWFFPVRCSVLHHKDPRQRQSDAGGFDHWYFPCICCLTGLNCYNVTSGSAICNNVASSSAMQVCKHGFTNMVSNVMTKWHFLSYNHQCFHVQIKFNMAHEIFQWLPLIFNDVSRQNAIFPGQHKIPWLFKSRVKFHDFSRPLRTMCIISKPSVNSTWSYSLETPNSGQNRWFFVPCDLEIWRMTLKNNRAPFLCCFKFCASFHSHHWIQTGVRVRKHLIWVKNEQFFEPCDLEIWRMTLKNNRAPLLSNIKLCASLHHNMWIQTGVTVWKWLSWVLTSVTLTFDLWPWRFAWTSLLSLVITPENFKISVNRNSCDGPSHEFLITSYQVDS